MDDSQDILVSVCVITYNQEQFIRQCLDSILMQKVNFNYELIVGDDYSKDSTRSILQDYQQKHPECVFPVLADSNSGISANYKRVLSRCKGKYIAVCEGDDFWIGPNRLQKQIDFLESHEEYGFVGGNATILVGNEMTFESYDYLPNPIVDGEWELYENVLDYAKFGPVTRTVTLCFRKSLIDPYVDIEGIGNDLVLQTILAKFSKFAKLSEAIGAYRQNGISTSTDNFDSIFRYANWRYECLSLQKELFPEDCNWDSDEVSDHRYYAILRYYIKHFQLRKVKVIRKKIRSKKFRNKVSYRFSNNLISSFLLGIFTRIRVSSSS